MPEQEESNDLFDSEDDMEQFFAALDEQNKFEMHFVRDVLNAQNIDR